MIRWKAFGAVVAVFSLSAASAGAAQITFTGGVVTLIGGATPPTTNNLLLYSANVDHYVEDGFKLDFIDGGSGGGSVGNYYGVIGDLTGPQPDNDVIHAHWLLGGIGAVTAVEITKVGGGTFDLNYFILTSNTDTGGAASNGTEQAFIQGFVSNVPTGAAQLLPPQTWGFPAQQIFLGAAFDAVDKVVFSVTNDVDCFGMDEFFIDEAAPPVAPEPASMLLLGTALVGVAMRYRRRNR